MSFFDMIQRAIDDSGNTPLKVRKARPHPQDPYWGTLPRSCRLCTNREESTPPDSLKKSGVKPCQFCKAFERACYLAVTVCRRVVEPLNFKVNKK